MRDKNRPCPAKIPPPRSPVKPGHTLPTGQIGIPADGGVLRHSHTSVPRACLQPLGRGEPPSDHTRDSHADKNRFVHENSVLTGDPIGEIGYPFSLQSRRRKHNNANETRVGPPIGGPHPCRSRTRRSSASIAAVISFTRLTIKPGTPNAALQMSPSAAETVGQNAKHRPAAAADAAPAAAVAAAVAGPPASPSSRLLRVRRYHDRSLQTDQRPTGLLPGLLPQTARPRPLGRRSAPDRPQRAECLCNTPAGAEAAPIALPVAPQ